ncbi:putative toxin-antitoxin system toxin component, PIN family [uncultured Methylibium sp.]|uniref:PIN domain-containing protein n=1 Tax=uncultured Methylibium sp. TaxID=381093 RepID=UPI0025F82817|nr:PIN domain-containing protein [uncultured Methylibium sp.]
MTLEALSVPPLGTAVLDTNTVLDWLVFDDPPTRGLGAAVGSGALRWIASVNMRLECLRVAASPKLAHWSPDPQHIGTSWDRWATIAAEPPRPGPLRCTDPDDQVFIDVALTVGVQWLLTRDRALLKLARRALPLGVQVLTPADWVRRVTHART